MLLNLNTAIHLYHPNNLHQIAKKLQPPESPEPSRWFHPAMSLFENDDDPRWSNQCRTWRIQIYSWNFHGWQQQNEHIIPTIALRKKWNSCIIMSTGYILYVIIYYVQSIPIYIYVYISSILYAIYISLYWYFWWTLCHKSTYLCFLKATTHLTFCWTITKCLQKHRNKGSPNLVPTSFQKSALLTCGVTAEESKSIKGTKGRMMFVVF